MRMNITAGQVFTNDTQDPNAEIYWSIPGIGIPAISINLFLGLPTNGYVLWLIVSGAGGTLESEFFTLNLTVSEILICLSNMVTISYFYLQTVPLKLASNFSFGLFSGGRLLFQTCICLERYLAVVHPVVFLRFKPLRYRLACCSVVWLLVLGSCLLNMFLSFSKEFYYFFTAQVLLGFGVMLFCCLSVLRALKHPAPGEGGRAGGREREREGSSNMKMRAFKIILIILVFTVLPQLPLIVLGPLRAISTVSDFVWAQMISFAFILVTGVVQPLLYIHRAGKLPCFKGLL